MRSRGSWIRFLWLGLSLFLFFLSGSGQDGTGTPGPNPITLPDEKSDLDAAFLVPGASALPDEANVNTVAPEAGPGVDYTSIQEAIDNSDSGDVILVQSGTYNETVTVQKPGLSVKGVDTGEGDPVVSGDGVESTVTLAADGCTVEGFVVINSGNPHAGISVDSDNNTIANNTVMINRGYGICLDRSRNSFLWGNKVKTNGFSGISVQNSSDNEIAANSVVNNTRNGIELIGSRRNRIVDNVASDNGEHGIRLHRSDDNVLARNIASNNTLKGISIEESEGTVTSGNVVIDAEKTLMPAVGGGSPFVNFTIVVTNAGQVDLDKVRVTDELPAGLEYVSDNRSGRLRGGEVEWALAGSLAANESAEIELIARLTGEVSGNLTNWIGATAETKRGVVVSDEDTAVVAPPLIVGPNESISKAIELARDGDVVEVKSGTYRENIVLNKSITLRGVDTGGGSPVLMGDGVRSTLTILANGCTIEGFVVMGSGNPHAGIEIVSGNNSISDNVIRNNRGYGILISEARGNTIISNQIRENGFDGVSVERSDENEVSDNLVSVNGKCGISLDGSYGNLLSANTIASNKEQGIGLLDSGENSLRENAVRGNSNHGVQLIGSEGNSISGNVASYNENDGIHLEGSNENDLSTNTAEGNLNGLRLVNSRTNTLSDNEVNKNKERGIRLEGSDENALSGNAVGENLLQGIYLISSDNNTLSGNTASGNNGAGIRLDSSSSNTLSRNTANNNKGEGIAFTASSGNNEIEGNTANGNGLRGFLLSSSSSNTLSDNTANENALQGVYLISSGKNTLSGNTASDNNGAGIRLDYSSSNTLSGNTASNNKGEGIAFTAFSGNNKIEGNTANGNGLRGFILSSSSGNTLSDNTANGNGDRGIYLTSSDGNSIYLNTFDNVNNAWSNSANTWHSPTKIEYRGNTTYVGNRWSDYSGWDCDGDGIGDWPCPIPGGSKQDQYPLTDRTGTRTITVCKSGGCDYTTIQAAVNAACPGGTVEVRGGTYRENVVVNKTLTLRGVDTLPVVGEGGGMPVVDGGGSGSAITITADGCSIEGFVARNSGGAWPCAGIYVTSNGNTISGNTAIGNKWDGISLNGCSGNKILGNVLTDNTASGIYIRNSTNNTITENTASSNGHNGIKLWPSSDNNLICSNNASDNIAWGISFVSSSNNNIDGNTVSGNGNDGICLESSTGNTISGNAATDNSQFGIYISSSSSNTISGNIASDNENGIRLDSSDGNTISGNTAISNDYGILLQSASNSNMLSENTVTSNVGCGIYILLDSDENTISNNTATNNNYGISIFSSSNNNISDNTATSNICSGISLMSSSGNVIESNTATDNSCGVGLLSSSNNKIKGNTANESTSGIRLDLSSNDNIISGNNATNNNWYGIRLESSSGNTIYLNTFENEVNAWSDSANTWHSPTEIDYQGNSTYVGNRWSDYSGWDCDGDGIGDVPYEIPGEAEEQDEYTLTDRTGTRTITVCKSGGCDYTTIQDAINAACPGDTIEVHSGPYYENVEVNKKLTMRGVDTGGKKPVVDAGGSGSAITISADNCTVEGFETTNSGGSWPCAGIYVVSNGNAISGNTAANNKLDGISLNGCSGNMISDNALMDNIATGIYLQYSNNNAIKNNTATGNAQRGIYILYSNSNTISDNTATGNAHRGIDLRSSSGNTLSGNTATDNGNGIYLISSSCNTLSGNTATGNYDGIYLSSSCNNTLSGNTATGNYDGIYLSSSCNNTLSGNTATGNYRYGIYLYSSSNCNTISGNTATANSNIGIYLASSSGNTLTGNTATGNYNGIYLSSSSNNTISGNTAAGNSYDGIYLSSSSNNTISGNTANYNQLAGIFLLSSSSNTISDNTAGNSYDGIYILYSNSNTISRNTATVNYRGIYLSSSSNNTISRNTATANTNYGIILSSSSDNTFSGNTANGNSNGILLGSSSRNNISGNTATGNSRKGIYLSSSSNNTIYLNTFDNASSVSSSNSWNSTAPLDYTYNLKDFTNYTGNYWSDYNGSDPDGDGIGNTPCVIGGSERDYRPMIRGGILTMTATALAPAILVALSGDLAAGSPSDAVNLTLKVTNPGPESLTSVKVVALISAGMSYLPGLASIDPDSVAEGENGTWNASWEDVGDLGAGEFVMIDFSARIDGDLLADLTTVATALALVDEGENSSLDERMKMSSPEAASLRDEEGGSGEGGDMVSGTDSWTVSVQGPANPLRVEKTADPMVAEPGDQVTFYINVTNSGGIALTNLTASDLLPAGMTYVSADPAPFSGPVENPNGSSLVSWTALPDLLAGGSIGIELVARVDDDARGNLTNNVTVYARNITGSIFKASDDATVELMAMNVTKTADKGEVKRGENITYNITVCNVGSLPLVSLVIEDVFDHQVEVISESISRGSDGRWHIDLLENDSCISIILIIKVPRQELEFMMASRAQGEGFVNVADDYSTTLDPFIIRNLVYAISDNLTKEYSDSASVTVLGEPGTELETREHGSGAYESEEVVSVRSLNKSIEMNKSVSATRGLTTLGLYHNRTVTFSSPWTEEATAKNRITGTSLSESYRYATSIDRESRFLLDQNESVMAVESEFVGMGHIGFLKKDVGEEAGSEPLFESSEDYTGSFRVLEKVDEYGSGIGSEKSASGLGLVAVDKRVGTSQRSYESGAGSYQSEELIRTETNYIGKDLSVERGQVNLSLSTGFSINSSMKWKEGMESRVANTSFLGEEYSGASRLDKETIAQGTNEMNTLANFTGKARYRAFLKDEIDFDEEYAGDYSIERRVLLKGVPRYERPHLSLRKEGEMVYPGMGASPLAKYTIILENDGDQSLGPVVVRDIFPPGAVYLNSSLRPSELAEGRATWTLTHLAIGDRFEIALLLNLTGYRGEDIVNQAEAEGGYGDNLTRARNFSALEIDWLRCCPSGDVVRVAKTGLADEIDPEVVIYEIAVENVGDGPAAVTLTDRLPNGMTVLEASPAFASLEDGVVTWNFIDLEPGETRTVAYRAQALWSGRFVNRVRADSSLVDGSKASTVYASSIVEVGEFEGEVPVPGWQPPDWGLNYSACWSDLEDEYLCEI